MPIYTIKQAQMMKEVWEEATKTEREACAKICEGTSIILDGKPARRGPNGAGTWYENSPVGDVTKILAAAIRMRSNITIEDSKNVKPTRK